MVRIYGPNGNDWIGCTVELYAGQTEYQGKQTDSVLLRPVTPPKPVSEQAPVKSPLDDEVPF